MPIKVTNLSPSLRRRGGAHFFAHYAARPRNAKAAPRGGPSRTPRRSKLSLNAGRQSVIAAAPEAGEAKTAHTKRHKRPRRRLRRRIIGRPVGQSNRERAITCRDRNTTWVG